MFYIIFDLVISFIFFILGFWFYKSNGKATECLSGYSKTIKSKDYETYLCKRYGKRMIIWGIIFVIGTCIDVFAPGIGCLLAWIIWFILFIVHLIDRTRKERQD